MNNDSILRDPKMPLPCVSGSERRMAIYQHTKPTGDGAIVLDYVDARLADMLGTARGVSEPLLKPGNIIALREDLFERAEMGKEKYGAYLRVNNGRVALVDLYQELLDAIMYSGQVRMETPTSFGANMFELLVNMASQVAGELDKR